MIKASDVLLQHILESIEWVEKDTAGFDATAFYAQVPIQDAVVRRLEIIGEAVRHLPAHLKEKHAGIPWQEIADMRNKLIHEYYDVDVELIWEVVTTNIPILKKAVGEMLKASSA